MTPRATTFDIRDFGPTDAAAVVEQHGTVYAAEYGWGVEFRDHVAEIVDDYLAAPASDRQHGWIAEQDGNFAGCVFVTEKSAREAQLRMLLVLPSARGRGLGGTLIQRCIDFSRKAGFDRLVLWTNDVLDPARRLYARAGFKVLSSEPHDLFGEGLVAETWSLELR